jgi:hypothetical protein
MVNFRDAGIDAVPGHPASESAGSCLAVGPGRGIARWPPSARRPGGGPAEDGQPPCRRLVVTEPGDGRLDSLPRQYPGQVACPQRWGSGQGGCSLACAEAADGIATHPEHIARRDRPRDRPRDRHRLCHNSVVRGDRKQELGSVQLGPTPGTLSSKSWNQPACESPGRRPSLISCSTTVTAVLALPDVQHCRRFP